MKICASCGASVPDHALICTACGSQEFTYSDPGYGQQDSYGYDDQQQYAPQYDQNGYGYEDQQQYAEQYNQNGYGYEDQQQYAEQYDQNGYGYDDQQQYAEQYDQNGYGYDDQQQYAEQYDQNGYDYEDQQQYTEQYDQSGYGYHDQPRYTQNGYGYDDQQQYAEQYDQNSYGYDDQQQYAEQYDQNGYDDRQQYAQPYEQNNYGYDERQQYAYQQEQYPQQPAAEEPQQVQQPVPQQVQQQVQQPAEQPMTAAAVTPTKEEKAPQPPEETPKAPVVEAPVQPEPKKEVFNSKDFKFERKKPAENNAEPEQEQEPLKGFAKILSIFTNTPDHTMDFDPDDIAKSKTTSIISLFGLTFWVPFAFSPRSAFSRYYANQGLLMLIVLLPFTLIYAMFAGIIGVACTTAPTLTDPSTHLSFMGVIMDLLFFLICYAIPIFMIYNGIRNIRAGKAKDIPFIGFLRLIR